MSARVYVGTYAKYNNGSIAGQWLELDNYSDHDAFIEACKELHKDEADPELMFQDFEGFPKSFYNESSIDPDLWDWLNLDEHDQTLLAAYQESVTDGTIAQARDAFMGKADTKADWAAEYWEEAGLLSQIPESLQNYIDYESYARDAELGGDVMFIRYEGDLWVFSNH